MKTITIKKKDAYDLAAVMATIVREKSEELDFKDVIGLQKMVNYILETVKDFSDKYDEITKDRNSIVEAANKKISTFRAKLMSASDKKGEMPEDYKEKLDAFVTVAMDETNAQVNEHSVPKMKELNDGIGEEDVKIELEEEKLKMLVINFEKFAKEKYTNKSKMVEVYELLTI